MKYFVTGGAGFIGSNLVDELLARGNEVVIYDNLSTGFLDFLKKVQTSPDFTLIKGDCLDQKALSSSMKGCDFVFHLAANADVRFGLIHPRKDLEQNTIVTHNVLEAMRDNGIKNIAFSSTGSIYGEPEVFPTPEDGSFPVQTSLYGASKLAAEGMIEAYCEGYGFKAWIFRFVSILGERYTHGHVFDFYQKLLKDPKKLYILGDGHQKKSYLYVKDCIEAMLLAIEKAQDKVNIFNLGTDQYCEVNDSVKWITKKMGLDPELTYSGGSRGWVGDSPFIFLDTSRIKSLGWVPSLKIEEAIIKTLEYLSGNIETIKKRENK
ncbi:MAG: NAD-dependent epimerase/dehydratase family protein [Candidatus Margulisiibacteriota bacterium]